MNGKETAQIWIEAGYELFALEGPDGILVEKLARKLGLNKSGFYYHFGDRDVFYSVLLQHHNRLIDEFCQAVSKCRSFDPDYLDLLFVYRITAFVQMQLRRNSKIPVFREAFNRAQRSTEKAALPLWAAHVKIPRGNPLVTLLWKLIRDLFHMQLASNTLTRESLSEMVLEFSEIMDKVRKLASIPDQVPVIKIRQQEGPGLNTGTRS